MTNTEWAVRVRDVGTLLQRIADDMLLGGIPDTRRLDAIHEEVAYLLQDEKGRWRGGFD